MKPRFKPNDVVWIIYNNKPLKVDIESVHWYGNYIEYEIQTISILGHQLFEIFEDTEIKKSELFNTKIDCQRHIDFIRYITND
jgi:hypothetical protein